MKKVFFIVCLMILFHQAFCFTISKEEISKACMAEIIKIAPYYAGKDISCNVLMKSVEAKYLEVNTENYRIKVTLGNKQKLNNYFHARVFIYEGKKIIEELRLKFNLKVYDNVYFARKGYPKKIRITEDMFYLRKADILRSARKYVAADYQFEEDISLKSKIRADFPLFEWMIKRKPAVTVGEKITVTIVQDNIIFRMQAKVLQEGNVGDKIAVQLIKTKKKFKAEIVDRGKYIIKL